MKILITSDWYTPAVNGVVTSVKNLRQALEARGHEVRILTLADKLSNMRSTARDYLMIGDQVWQRFHEKRKASHQWYASGILEALSGMKAYPEYQEMDRLYHMVFGA